jgi:hypothetical protein
MCGPTPTTELLAVCADKECSALQGGTRGAEFIDLWDRGRERCWLTEGVGRGFSGMEGAHRRRGRRCCVLSPTSGLPAGPRENGPGLSHFWKRSPDATTATRLVEMRLRLWTRLTSQSRAYGTLFHVACSVPFHF